MSILLKFCEHKKRTLKAPKTEEKVRIIPFFNFPQDDKSWGGLKMKLSSTFEISLSTVSETFKASI